MSWSRFMSIFLLLAMRERWFAGFGLVRAAGEQVADAFEADSPRRGGEVTGDECLGGLVECLHGVAGERWAQADALVIVLMR